MSSTVISTYTDDSFQAFTPGSSLKVSFTNTSSVTGRGVSTGVNVVQLFATENCWVAFGASPTAAANDGASFYLAANMIAVFGIPLNSKIAVIRDSTNGDLHILEAA